MARFPRGRERLIGGVALGAMLLAFVVVYLLVRGGDDGRPASAQPTGDPTRAPSASLIAGSLPGDGWTSSETELVSLFDAPDPAFAATPDLPECESVRVFENALFANEAAFTGGESRLFERPLADGGVVRVTQLAVTFSDAAAVEAVLASAREAFGGPELPACMLAAALRDGIEASAEDGPALPVPPDGFSRVLRYTATSASGGGTVTQAVGWWVEGVRLVMLTVSAAGEGPSDAELAAIGQAASGGGQ